LSLLVTVLLILSAYLGWRLRKVKCATGQFIEASGRSNPALMEENTILSATRAFRELAVKERDPKGSRLDAILAGGHRQTHCGTT
jgi:hypothetical protein